MADASGPWQQYQSASGAASPGPWSAYQSAPDSGSPKDQIEKKLAGVDTGSFLGSVVHGGTFGLSDEIGAGLGGALQYGVGKLTGNAPKGATLGDFYDANLENTRRDLENYTQQHPALNTAGEFLGGVMDFNPEAATAALAKGFLPTVRQGATTGAAIGAAQGFGNAEGGVENRLKGAAAGGAGGGALGAVAPVAVPWLIGGVKSAGTMIQRAIAPWTKDLDGFISETAGNVLNKAAGPGGVTLQDAPLPGMAPTLGQQSDNAGIQYLERSIEQASPEGALNAAQARTTNNQAISGAIKSLGDVGSDSSAGMRAALTRNSPQMSGAGQVLDLAQSHLGDQNFYDSIQSLAAARSQASAPIWQAAMDRPPVITDRLSDFMADPDIQQGMRQGIKLARREALAEGKPFDPNAYAITGFNEAGDPEIGPVPTWRTWQAAKEGLDAQINSLKDGFGRLPKTKEVNSLVGLKNALVQELDNVNPDYAAARAAWSGPSDSMNALNQGREIFKPDSEITAQRIAALSPGDKFFHNIGVMRAVEDVANNSPNGTTALNSLLAKPSVGQKLAASFGSPEGFAEFQGQAQKILNPQADIGAAMAKDNAGEFKMPTSGVADQFIRSGKGGPEALNAYLDRVGSDPEGLQAARDAFTQKFLDQVETTLPDSAGTPLISASKVNTFLDNYGHVVQSRLYDDAQRDMMQRIADAADMSQRVARAGAKGGSDTFAKLQGKTFLDVLIGPGASKFVPGIATAVGGVTGGPFGAAAGFAAARASKGDIEQLLYGATRDKVVSLVHEALNNPALAKTLMGQASAKAALQIPIPQRRLIYSILGAQVGSRIGGALSGTQGQSNANSFPTP